MDNGSLLIGLLISAIVNVVMLALSFVAVFGGLVFVLAGFGLLQVLWLLPFYVAFSIRGKSQTRLGIALGAGLTFILSAACWSGFRGKPF